MEESNKPNRYECVYRCRLIGDAHSSCAHPLNGDISGNVMTNLVTMIRLNGLSALKLNITANQHGVSHGWFMWPANFDPTWLLTCSGFTQKEKVA